MKNTLKNFNVFMDGRGYAGKCEEAKLPELKIKTESFRAGGMDSEIDVDQGIEKLEASFVLASYEPEVLKQFGIADGASVPFVFKGAFQDDAGKTIAATVTMTGKITSLTRDAWKAGENSKMTINMTLHYFKEVADGATIYEIDIKNMKRVIDGVDQMEAIRSAIGL